MSGLFQAVAFQRRPLSTLIEAQRTAGDCSPRAPGGPRRAPPHAVARALLEPREVLAHIVRRFEIEPAGERPEDARVHGTALIPVRGARVVLRPR